MAPLVALMQGSKSTDARGQLLDSLIQAPPTTQATVAAHAGEGFKQGRVAVGPTSFGVVPTSWRFCTRCPFARR